LALVGESGKAVDWLTNAVSRGLCAYPLLAERDPLLAGVRGMAEFGRVLRAAERKWRAFEV
jgi:hypothetical protein